MTFTENLYLKRQLKQLQEENLKLKQILSEADILGGDIVDAFMQRTKPGSKNQPPKAEQNTPSASDVMGSEIVDRFMRTTTPIGKMTPEEAFQHGADHARLQGISTPPHFFNNPHFAAGFNSVK
jgi:hypothetical protein